MVHPIRASAYLIAALMITIIATVASARTLSVVNFSCQVKAKTSAIAVSQTACKTAYTEAFARLCVEFCKDPKTPVPPSVVADISATAKTAVATAVATATAQYCMTGSISASCLPSAYASFSSSAQSKAVAMAVAQSMASAFASVSGANAYADVGTEVEAISNALAQACRTRFLSINSGMLYCQTPQPCPAPCYSFQCLFGKDASVTVTATAVAQAIAQATAVVQNYVSTCDSFGYCGGEQALCGFVCDGSNCPVPSA